MTEAEKAEYSKHELLTNIFTHIQDFSIATHLARLVQYALSEPGKTWQPMETVPKTGKEVLLKMVCGDAYIVASYYEGKWFTLDGPSYVSDDFTHWMNIPE